jgi:hypothetical protein
MCSQITFGDSRFHNTQVCCCWFFMFLYKLCLCILLCGLCLCVLGLDLLFASELCFELSKIWSSYVVLQLDLVCSSISFGLGCLFCMRFCMTNVVKVSFCFSVFVVFKFIFYVNTPKTCNWVKVVVGEAFLIYFLSWKGFVDKFTIFWIVFGLKTPLGAEPK